MSLYDHEIRAKLSTPHKPKEEPKMNVWKLIKIILPVAQRIVKDVQKAKQADSEGGKKVTKEEIQQIIVNNVADMGELIEDIVSEL
jgi:hypothetical protein